MGEVDNNYKDRSLIVKSIGLLLVFLGISAAIIGPYEIYAFYLFSKGGRFHYEGFGFGSFMFANIAWQIIGYYVIAFLCIPLGYGHIQLRRWIVPAMQSLLWCGLILGIPLIVVFLFMLSVKDLSLTASVFVIAVLALFYFVGQVVLIRFYKSRNVQHTITLRNPHSHQIEQIPLRVLVLTTLFIFYIVFLHVPLFLNGIFPMFGFWLSDVQGFIAADFFIISLSLLTWGVYKQKFWGWLGSVLFFSFLTSTVIITLVQSSFSEMIAIMKFPVTELELLKGIPLNGIHFAPFIGIPLAFTLTLLVYSKRFFKRSMKENI